ncbi:MAG TPA: amino acid permease [Puia sp.]|nr:amino acid permease [Puia sp.]
MDHPKELNRSLSVGMAIVVTVASIIGSGVYKKIAPMAGELHSAGWVLICWVLGGVISLFGALSNAEVAGLLADTGGEYVYYKKIYNHFFAFMLGWSLFTIIQTGAISSLAYIFAQSLNSIFHFPPVLASLDKFTIGGIFYPFAGFNVKLVAIALILLFTWVNTRGVKQGAGIATLMVILIFTGILLIIIFGFSSSQSHLNRVFVMPTDNGQTVTFTAVFTAMLAAFWAYQGWAGVGYIGGEIKNPKRNIPIGISVGIVIIITFYVLVNMAYLSLLPIPRLVSIYQSTNSVAAVEAVNTFWGRAGEIFISLLIAATTMNTTHTTILISSRVYYAMALEGLFFSPVRHLNRKQVPYFSLWYQGIWGSVLVLSGTFDQLTDMVIFAVFIFYGATALGVFILRKKMPDAPRPYRVWAYPIVPAIVVLFSLLLFFNTIFARPREAAIGMVLMLTGVPFYFWFRNRSRSLAVSNKDLR